MKYPVKPEEEKPDFQAITGVNQAESKVSQAFTQVNWIEAWVQQAAKTCMVNQQGSMLRAGSN